MSRKDSNLPTRPDEQSEILLYQTEDGRIRLETRLQDETVWLTQDQMSTLFDKAKSTINEHIKNIFAEGELIPEQVMKKFGISEFQQKVQNFYNLYVDDFLKLSGRDILTHAGKISHDKALRKAHEEFEKFHARQLEEPTEVEKHFVEAEAELKKIEASRKKGGKA